MCVGYSKNNQKMNKPNTSAESSHVSTHLLNSANLPAPPTLPQHAKANELLWVQPSDLLKLLLLLLLLGAAPAAAAASGTRCCRGAG